ncbi:MAG: Uma2 family endonuclease [Capnocytophaga sp.]|nr:Uma2 family endonuclease [Capnocytophaga sp.]
MAEILNINDLDLNSSYTYADYLLWKFQERVELIKGKIFRLPTPLTKHQEVSFNMGLVLGVYFENKPCRVFSAPFDVRLTTKDKKNNEVTTVIQPDLCVICDTGKLDKKGCVGAPDLVVEVLSPGNSKKELKIKYGLYEENGVKEYWIIDPSREDLQVFSLENGKFSFKGTFFDDDEINSSLFPELKIDLKRVFR